MKSFKSIRLTITLFILLILVPALGLSAGLNQVKTAFLYNIAHYVNWSGFAFQTKQSPLNICLVANDEFTQLLQLTVKDELIKQRAITVQSLTLKSSTLNCHVLFISQTKAEKIPNNKKQGLHTLIVSDIENSANHGAMIEFRVVNEKVKLFINYTVTKQAELSISARLLSLATIVENEK